MSSEGSHPPAAPTPPAARDPLDVEAVLGTLCSSSTTDPAIPSRSHLVLAVMQACFRNLGFVLAAGGTPAAGASGSADCSCSLTLRHPQSALTFVLKAIDLPLPTSALGEAGTLIVHAVAVEDGKILNITIPLQEYLTAERTGPETHYPISSAELQGPDAVQALARRFQSREALDRLIELIKVEIVQKWVPSLYKPGHEESRGGGQSLTAQEPTSTPRTGGIFILPAPAGPAAGTGGFFHPPPLGPLPGGGPYPVHPGVHPYGIGDVDLDPFAVGPPVFPRLGGIGGGMHPGGGMFVGPEHPMFQQPPYSGPPLPEGRPRLPPGAVPPGARFDPITPFDPAPRPGVMRPRPPMRPPFGGGAPPFSGDPDPDDAPPPGYGDMFL